MLIGALEAGGTKMVCAIGDERGNISESAVLPTETPAVTMPRIWDFFSSYDISALGIGSFGPLDIDQSSPTYGYIKATPKLEWRDYDLLGFFREKLQVKNGCDMPLGFDTDVNAACLGEAAYGAARDVDSSIYITVGTGIGVGIMSEGRLLHGLTHPEAGHIIIARAENDGYEGGCPYHNNGCYCLEGMAGGPAIEKRWGSRAEELAEQPGVWELEAYYLAQAIASYILILSPKRIILGGGVMKQARLFPLIRKKTEELLGGYVSVPPLDEYIIPPALGDKQGIMGAIKLALASMA